MPLRIYPRIRFDIGWRRLASIAFRPTPTPQAHARNILAIEGHWAGRHVVTGLSARSLFDACLTALSSPKGTVLVTSAVNIEGMFEIARHHGFRLVAVDIDPSTGLPRPGSLAQACQENKAKVCLIAHLFGAAGPIPDLTALREMGVVVIEDCAQAFAGTFFKGSKAADVSLFSFGPIKRATALAGAVAVCRTPELAAALRSAMGPWPEKTPPWLKVRALKYLVLKLASTPLIFGQLVRIIRWTGKNPDTALGSTARGFSGENLITAIRHRPPRGLIAAMAHRLGEHHDWIGRRQSLDPLTQVVPVPTSEAAHHAAWLAPILVDDPERAVETLRQHGFDATRGATSLRCLDPSAAPQSARLLRHIVYLPHPTLMPASAAKRLTRLVGAFQNT